jgi:methyltransferase family protein
MKYTYKNARIPFDNKLRIELEAACERVFQKIQPLDLGSIDIGDDIKIFFAEKKNSLATNLIKYSYHLGLAVAKANRPINELTIIDHGGGTGLMGMLAKDLGFGKVIYSDINEEWTNDAKKIATKLNLLSDFYVSGDFSDLLNFIKGNSLSADVIVSYNVIEHIYNIYDFCSALTNLNNKSLVVVMSTGANMYNKGTRKVIVPTQIIAEYGDENGKFGDDLPYNKIRENIIKEHRPELKQDVVGKLVKATRGMIKEDITKTVDEYLKTNVMPPEPVHTTNTCDPYTGYWAEHFMDPRELQGILIKQNYNVEILAGYYGAPNSKLRRFIGSVLNGIIKVFGTKALAISPYWTIYAKK